MIGVLNAYRGRFGEWSPEQIELLGALADHAAIAIQTAQLLRTSRAGRCAASRSSSARFAHRATSTRTSSTRSTASSPIDEVDEARNLIAVADDHYEGADARVTREHRERGRLGLPARRDRDRRQRGYRAEIEVPAARRGPPATLTDLDVITILGNLIHNATEAVLGQPTSGAGECP